MRIPLQSPPVNRVAETTREWNQWQLAIIPSANCWSAVRCGEGSGHILNHKDRHNCCNSGGASWEDRFGTCYHC